MLSRANTLPSAPPRAAVVPPPLHHCPLPSASSTTPALCFSDHFLSAGLASDVVQFPLWTPLRDNCSQREVRFMYLAYLVTRCVVITRRKQQRPGITTNDKNIGTHKSTRSCGCVVAGSWLSASLRLAACKRLTTVLHGESSTDQASPRRHSQQCCVVCLLSCLF